MHMSKQRKKNLEKRKIAEVERCLDPPLPRGWPYIGYMNTVLLPEIPVIQHDKFPKNKKRYDPSIRDQFKWQNSQTNRKLDRLKRA